MHNWNWNKESNQNYLYDGLSFDVLAEFRDTDFSGNTKNSFGWGGWNSWNHGNTGRYKPVFEYVTANGDIVSRTDFNENSSRWGSYPQLKNKEYYSQDVLGSVIMLTDSWGNTKDTYSYDAFGNQYGDNSFGHSYGNGWTTGAVNEYGYNGKRFDSAVGLADYGFRDYAPQVGRFTTLDPIKDGLNWYVYVGNDPVNFVDPYGLYTQAEWDLFKEDPLSALKGKHNADEADKTIKYNDTLIPGAGRNDEEDAVRHAYWSAMNTRDTDEETARKIGEAHEDVSLEDQPIEEKEMDLFNNEVGINIGVENPNATNEQLFNEVLNALDNDLLQTSPKEKDDPCERAGE